MDLDPDPDTDRSNFVDPDTVNPDPHHWLCRLWNTELVQNIRICSTLFLCLKIFVGVPTVKGASRSTVNVFGISTGAVPR